MGIIEQLARSVLLSDERSETYASPSPSTEPASDGAAIIADGETEHITNLGRQWALTKRGLTPSTLRQLGVDFGTESFRDPERSGRFLKLPAIRFHYGAGHYKGRAIPEKMFMSNKGFQPKFWNLDNVLAGIAAGHVSRVYIVEGELDACALVEAGVPYEAVLSVPNGANEKATKKDDLENRYKFVEEALEAGLNKAEQLVWCGDSDAPGTVLRNDMVRVLGEAKFWFVEWPEGCKDANSFLQSDGNDALLSLVSEGARQWPISGLFRMSEMPEPPNFTLWSLGYPALEGKISIAPRTLSVATGHPGHGKTQWWTQTWYQIAKRYDFPIALASFETHPKPHLRRHLRSLFSGVLEREMHPREIAKADAWIEDHYHLIKHLKGQPTLTWLLETAASAVIRYGARALVIDPWNYLEQARAKDESETEYIGRCLRECRAFAEDMNCHVQILAHPAKMATDRRNRPPELEDISGSKNWDNAPDQGFVIYRPKTFDEGGRRTDAQFYYLKSRFTEELGYPHMQNLNFNLATQSYECVEIYVETDDEEVASSRRRNR